MNVFNVVKPKPGELCVGQQSVSREEFVARSGGEMFEPRAASPVEITDYIYCDLPAPVLKIGRVYVEYEWHSNPDITATFKRRLDPGQWVEEVQGELAWVQPAVTDEGLNAILFLKGTVGINVVSPSDVPMSELIEVANSLDLTRTMAQRAQDDAAS